jgi:hypothetical protein
MGVFSSIGRGVRKAAALPFILVPWREIKESGRSIEERTRDLWSQTQQARTAEQQVICDGDRLVDLRAFAEARGLSDGQAIWLLTKRRRETAIAAYACFVFVRFGNRDARGSSRDLTRPAIVHARRPGPFGNC